MWNINNSNGRNSVEVYLDSNNQSPIACIQTKDPISNFFRTPTGDQANCLEAAVVIGQPFHCKVRICTVGCGTNPPQQPANGNFTPLKDLYPSPLTDPNCGMYIGAATTALYKVEENNNELGIYQNAMRNHFHMTVPENGLKMEILKSNKDFLTVGTINQELDGLKDMPTRGHTLIWHGAHLGPFYLSSDPNTLKGQLITHVNDVINKIDNAPLNLNIESWDVVNEALRGTDPDIHDSGRISSYRSPFRTAEKYGEFTDGRDGDKDDNANGIRCIWEKIQYEPGTEIRFTVFDDIQNKSFTHVIPKYIELAFRTADGKTDKPLIYNDWGAEVPGREIPSDPNNKLKINGNKAEYQFQMIKALIKDADVKIDGVGFQCHFTVDDRKSFGRHKLGFIDKDRINRFRDNILRYVREFGPDFKIYLTEVDIELPVGLLTDEYRKRQFEAYYELMKMAIEIEQVKGFITWGTADKYSWKSKDLNGNEQIDPFENLEPLLFDDNFNPKLRPDNPKIGNYQAIVNAINDAIPCSANAWQRQSSFQNISPIFTAYPNPFDKTIQIDLEESKGQMKIYDMTGRTILSQSINSNQTNINTKDLKAGYYLIEVESNGETQTQKIIKH